MRGRELAGWLALAVAACDGSSPIDAGAGEADAGSAPVAVFSPAGVAPIGWRDVPWPSDLHIGADGTVDVTSLPGRGRVWEPVHDALRRRRGFCVSCAVYFPITGTIDAASLRDDAVWLVALDEAGAPGERVPVTVELHLAEGVIAARPRRGLVLRTEQTYAAALVAGITAADGAPLAPSPAFVAVRDGTPDADERAVRIVGPAIDAVERLGVARTDIVAATAFTTDDPVVAVRALTALADTRFAAAPPTVTFERVYRDAELDDLFGVPAAPAPGLDNPSADGEEGDVGVAHGGLAMLVLGTVRGPRVVEGAGTDIGFPRVDASGAPVAGPEDEVIPWLLFVPAGVDLSRVPVVLSLSGLGGRKEHLAAIQAYMEAGYAVLKYDAFGHGRRATTAEDLRHELRGEGAPETPDGLEEHNGTIVVARGAGLDGAASGLTGCPLYGLGAAEQLVLDAKTMLRTVRDGDWSSVRASVPELASLAFDPARVAVMGISLGSAVATTALVDEAGVEAALIVVSYGSTVDLGIESPRFRPATDTLYQIGLGIRDLSIYDEQVLHLGMNPLIDTYRWLVDGFEPQVAGRHLTTGPALAARPDLLWQMGELDEDTGTATADSLCAALDLPGVGDFPTVELATATLPVSANLPDGRTAVCHRWAGAGHGVTTYQRATRAHDPPIQHGQREVAEVAYDNPIDAAIAEQLRFLETAFAGTAEVAAP